MSLCGIKKFDKLPARVGEIPVDYYRYCILRDTEEIAKYTKTLEFAIKLNKENKEKLKCKK